jgi:hypothetical protein
MMMKQMRESESKNWGSSNMNKYHINIQNIYTKDSNGPKFLIGSLLTLK